VVNKADRPGADQAVRDLVHMLTLGSPRLDWRTPVIKTAAVENTGIDDLIEAIKKHRAWAAESGEAHKRNVDAMRSEVQTLLRDKVLRDLAARMSLQSVDEVVLRVVDKTLDPYAAVDELLRL
jgi:LAO/AO transport system kinase